MIGLLGCVIICAQVPELMTPCVSQLKLCLTEDTFGEIAILGDKTNHEGLRDACMDFAMQKENRYAHHI